MMSNRPVALAACIALSLTLVAASPPTAAKAATYPPGIDVSHWQGTINWSKVAAAGIRFAIHKASGGRFDVDPMYTTNRGGARRAGIKWGAYHFARPGTGSNDAVAQANHFVNTALLKSGNIIPALDLEVTGGLGTTALRKWVSAWLGRVKTRMGVKPMIYTSPNFWKTYMGNTTAFADHGYKILWIAHYTSNSSPSVPANNWGGNSWTFWQWTSCRSVPGISGCVDGDRYHWTDRFAKVTIP
jgi:GH25 family lysozyme M1 (1,4-beta-N-acetylmuramidase)